MCLLKHIILQRINSLVTLNLFYPAHTLLHVLLIIFKFAMPFKIYEYEKTVLFLPCAFTASCGL